MKTLDRMLFAEAKKLWRQGVAISILLGCGIAVFVMGGNTMRSLEFSCDRYYESGRFGDLFVSLVRAPNRLSGRIEAIEGVQRVQTRISRHVLLSVPEMVEPASCRLLSIQGDPRDQMNRVFLRKGRFPRDSGRVEVIASELFAEAHGLVPGDHLDAILGERQERLHVVGIGLSPEFVYVVQPGMMVTDDRRYGVLWMPRRQMEAAFNMEGAFNDLSVLLHSRASEAAVMEELNQLTRPYGGTDSYDRDDQPSHHRVADEIRQMQTMGYVMPSIFLAVSAFLCNIVFSRLIHQQKEQIATLRAFGYLPYEIALHYTKLVLLLVSTGTALGLIAGLWMSDWMLAEYARFFRFPKIDNLFSPQTALLAIVAAATVSLLGASASINKAMRLVPAEAMRPEAPPDFRGLISERLGIARRLTPIGGMILRRLETNVWATTLSVLGMSLALAILMLGSFMEDTLDYVIDSQFQRSQRQDVTLTFNEACSADVIHEVTHLPGVTSAEGFRVVPVRMRVGRRSYRTSIMGVSPNPQLQRVTDDRHRSILFPRKGGLTITEKLAEILNVRPGDGIEIEVMDGKRMHLTLPVSRVFANLTEPGAYMNRRDLHQLLQEGEQYSGVYLAVAPGKLEALYRQVKQTPIVAGVTDKQSSMKNFRDLVSEGTSVMRSANAVFAMLIAFGVIYNCSMIILSERSRDLATLRVMGFTRHEAARVLLGEIATITLLSIPVGLPIGYGLCYLTSLALDTESYRFPLVIGPATYAYATSVILAAAAFSGLYVRRMVNDLDLISVLKVKE